MLKNTKAQANSKRYIKDIGSKNGWSVFKIISDFVGGFEELDELGVSVTIFGSARTSEDDKYYKKAELLSQKLANRGLNVITGGGPGIMEAANKGAFSSDKVDSVGLNIELSSEQNLNAYTTKNKRFDYFFSRKVMLVKYSMAYVIFPGGYGTLDELFESLTLAQTGKILGTKVFIVGVEFYAPLLEFIKKSLLKESMITQEDLDMIVLTDDLDLVVSGVEESIYAQKKLLEEQGLCSTEYYQRIELFCDSGSCE
ncbi:MAG: TIGR00730 family Rossman fold protein [Helicobacteraceae bacterium]|nr:TIGR00730 family Rossman fold protein [Helicobacteraceae bacterium]